MNGTTGGTGNGGGSGGAPGVGGDGGGALGGAVFVSNGSSLTIRGTTGIGADNISTGGTGGTGRRRERRPVSTTAAGSTSASVRRRISTPR